MTKTALQTLLALDPTPTDHDIIRACLTDSYGRQYPTQVAMYRQFRQMLDTEGYTGGLASGPNSISCVAQYYQPRDRRGQIVLRFNPDMSEADDILIVASCDGYIVCHVD